MNLSLRISQRREAFLDRSHSMTSFHSRKEKVPQPLGLRDSRFVLAVWTRLELATPCVTGMYSNQLNYQTWSLDLNKRLPVCERANIRLCLSLVASGLEIFFEGQGCDCHSKSSFIKSFFVNTLNSSVPEGHFLHQSQVH